MIKKVIVQQEIIEQYWIEKREKTLFFYKNKEYEDIERRFRERNTRKTKSSIFFKNSTATIMDGDR